MDEMLVKPIEVKSRAIKAFERVGKMYSWDSIVEDVVEVYEDALLEQHNEKAYEQTSF